MFFSQPPPLQTYKWLRIKSSEPKYNAPLKAQPSLCESTQWPESTRFLGRLRNHISLSNPRLQSPPWATCDFLRLRKRNVAESRFIISITSGINKILQGCCILPLHRPPRVIYSGEKQALELANPAAWRARTCGIEKSFPPPDMGC